MSLPTAAPPAPGLVWCVFCDVWVRLDDMLVEFGARAGNPRGDATATSYGAPYNAGICLHHKAQDPLSALDAEVMAEASDLLRFE